MKTITTRVPDWSTKDADGAPPAEPEALEERIAKVGEGLRDIREGRTRSLDAYIAAVREREGLPADWPPKAQGCEAAPGVFVVEE